MSDQATSPRDRQRALARFRQLVERALFELRLAGDIARAEGYGPGLTRGVEAARGSLRTALEEAKRRQTDG